MTDKDVPATIAETIKPFAVLGGPILTAAFGQEIVANKIFCVDCMPSQPNSYYVQHSPYVIGLGMNADEAQIQLADYIGSQLKGRPAAFAGDPAMHHETRKFGLVYISTGQDSEIQTNDFVQSLAKFGVTLSARLAYASPVTIDSTGLIAKLKAGEVSDPLRTPTGYHIIKLNEVRGGSEAPMSVHPRLYKRYGKCSTGWHRRLRSCPGSKRWHAACEHPRAAGQHPARRFPSRAHAGLNAGSAALPVRTGIEPCAAALETRPIQGQRQPRRRL